MEELAGVAVDCGISGFILMGDDQAAIERFGREVAPTLSRFGFFPGQV
ncbi:MAG TPA: hypothetical protein VFW16_01470 [Streptosporangiaceae bacterium]|nr:hypothetical protein [Streptosporangiaceae bacterium]